MGGADMWLGWSCWVPAESWGKKGENGQGLKLGVGKPSPDDYTGAPQQFLWLPVLVGVSSPGEERAYGSEVSLPPQKPKCLTPSHFL